MSNSECYERMLAGDDIYDRSDALNKKQALSKNAYTSNNKTCDTCIKSDVCMYKAELSRAKENANNIIDSISADIFEISVICKKWSCNINSREINKRGK